MVSVVVPIYNVEAYLRNCVDSLLEQDYADLEIILVDDGSPDGSPAIADEYAEKYDHITCYHKPNGGLGDARNYGVTRAKGEWVAFVDSDDDVSPTYISDLVKLREQFAADMAVTRIQRTAPGQELSNRNAFANYCISGKEALWQCYAARTIGWEACGKLFSQQVLIKNPFPAGANEDCACLYRIFYKAGMVAVGDFANDYRYNIREGSILNSPLKPTHMRIFEICDEFQQFISGKYDDADLLGILLRRAAVTQMLKCQSMGWKQYRSIFLRYRMLFRKALPDVMKEALPSKVKLDYLLHCTTPGIYKAVDCLLQLGRRLH